MRQILLALLGCVSFTAAVDAQTPLSISGLPERPPFTLSAVATENVLIVDLRFDDDWHAYSKDVGGGMPVQLVLADSDFEALGPLELPAPEDGKLEDAVRLRLPLEPQGDADVRELRATLSLQVCDALECLEPMTIELVGEIEPLDVLLVSDAADARADRIAAWLGVRGFRVARTLYAEIDAEMSRAADVVLADSKLFREHGVQPASLSDFPKTETPIVAVGFLGTELVERHGLAMTSGYI